MNSQKTTQSLIEDTKIDLKIKIVSIWTSFMFLYIYVDYFHLYMPGMLQDILAGKVFVFDITQMFLLVAMIFVIIPALMIFLSVILPANINRWTNLIVATLYIPYMLFNLAWEAWLHMYIAAAAEVALLLLVIWYSWKWPRTKI